MVLPVQLHPEHRPDLVHHLRSGLCDDRLQQGRTAFGAEAHRENAAQGEGSQREPSRRPASLKDQGEQGFRV